MVRARQRIGADDEANRLIFSKKRKSVKQNESDKG